MADNDRRSSFAALVVIVKDFYSTETAWKIVCTFLFGCFLFCGTIILLEGGDPSEDLSKEFVAQSLYHNLVSDQLSGDFCSLLPYHLMSAKELSEILEKCTKDIKQGKMAKNTFAPWNRMDGLEAFLRDVKSYSFKLMGESAVKKMKENAYGLKELSGYCISFKRIQMEHLDRIEKCLRGESVQYSTDQTALFLNATRASVCFRKLACSLDANQCQVSFDKTMDGFLVKDQIESLDRSMSYRDCVQWLGREPTFAHYWEKFEPLKSGNGRKVEYKTEL
jgi:hypothetical protein